MLYLPAPVGELLLALVAKLVDLVLALKDYLLFPGLSGLDRVANNAFGLLLGRADGGLSLGFPIVDPKEERRRPRERRSKDRDHDTQPYRYTAQSGTSFIDIRFFKNRY